MSVYNYSLFFNRRFFISFSNCSSPYCFSILGGLVILSTFSTSGCVHVVDCGFRLFTQPHIISWSVSHCRCRASSIPDWLTVTNSCKDLTNPFHMHVTLASRVFRQTSCCCLGCLSERCLAPYSCLIAWCSFGCADLTCDQTCRMSTVVCSHCHTYYLLK